MAEELPDFIPLDDGPTVPRKTPSAPSPNFIPLGSPESDASTPYDTLNEHRPRWAHEADQDIALARSRGINDPGVIQRYHNLRRAQAGVPSLPDKAPTPKASIPGAMVSSTLEVLGGAGDALNRRIDFDGIHPPESLPQKMSGPSRGADRMAQDILRMSGNGDLIGSGMDSNQSIFPSPETQPQHIAAGAAQAGLILANPAAGIAALGAAAFEEAQDDAEGRQSRLLQEGDYHGAKEVDRLSGLYTAGHVASEVIPEVLGYKFAKAFLPAARRTFPRIPGGKTIGGRFVGSAVGQSVENVPEELLTTGLQNTNAILTNMDPTRRAESHMEETFWQGLGGGVAMAPIGVRESYRADAQEKRLQGGGGPAGVPAADAVQPQPTAPSPDAVQQRAYAIWEKEKDAPRPDDVIWAEAEQQIGQEQAAVSAALSRNGFTPAPVTPELQQKLSVAEREYQEKYGEPIKFVPAEPTLPDHKYARALAKKMGIDLIFSVTADGKAPRSNAFVGNDPNTIIVDVRSNEEGTEPIGVIFSHEVMHTIDKRDRIAGTKEWEQLRSWMNAVGLGKAGRKAYENNVKMAVANGVFTPEEGRDMLADTDTINRESVSEVAEMVARSHGPSGMEFLHRIEAQKPGILTKMLNAVKAVGLRMSALLSTSQKHKLRIEQASQRMEAILRKAIETAPQVSAPVEGTAGVTSSIRNMPASEYGYWYDTNDHQWHVVNSVGDHGMVATGLLEERYGMAKRDLARGMMSDPYYPHKTAMDKGLIRIVYQGGALSLQFSEKGVKNLGNVDSLAREALKGGQPVIVEVGDNKGNHSIRDPKEWTRFAQTIQRQGLQAAIRTLRAPRGPEQVKGGLVTAENIPHPTSGELPTLESAPHEVRSQFTNEVENRLHDQSTGVELLAKSLGIATTKALPGPGLFQGKENPGRQIPFRVRTEHLTPDGRINSDGKRLVDGWVAARGILTRQAAMAYHRPVPVEREDDANAIDFAMSGRKWLKREEVQPLYNALVDAFGQTIADKIAVVPVPHGVRFLNTAFIKNPEFVGGIERAFDRAFPDAIATEWLHGWDGNFIENDWTANKNGEDYQKVVDATGSPDLQEWLQRLGVQIEGVLARYRKRFGGGRSLHLGKEAYARTSSQSRDVQATQVLPQSTPKTLTASIRTQGYDNLRRTIGNRTNIKLDNGSVAALEGGKIVVSYRDRTFAEISPDDVTKIWLNPKSPALGLHVLRDVLPVGIELEVSREQVGEEGHPLLDPPAQQGGTAVWVNAFGKRIPYRPGMTIKPQDFYAQIRKHSIVEGHHGMWWHPEHGYRPVDRFHGTFAKQWLDQNDPGWERRYMPNGGSALPWKAMREHGWVRIVKYKNGYETGRVNVGVDFTGIPPGPEAAGLTPLIAKTLDAGYSITIEEMGHGETYLRSPEDLRKWAAMIGTSVSSLDRGGLTAKIRRWQPGQSIHEHFENTARQIDNTTGEEIIPKNPLRPTPSEVAWIKGNSAEDLIEHIKSQDKKALIGEKAQIYFQAKLKGLIAIREIDGIEDIMAGGPGDWTITLKDTEMWVDPHVRTANHARLLGEVAAFDEKPEGQKVTYDPGTRRSFVKDTGQDFKYADKVVVTAKGMFATGIRDESRKLLASINKGRERVGEKYNPIMTGTGWFSLRGGEHLPVATHVGGGEKFLRGQGIAIPERPSYQDVFPLMFARGYARVRNMPSMPRIEVELHRSQLKEADPLTPLVNKTLSSGRMVLLDIANDDGSLEAVELRGEDGKEQWVEMISGKKRLATSGKRTLSSIKKYDSSTLPRTTNGYWVNPLVSEEWGPEDKFEPGKGLYVIRGRHMDWSAKYNKYKGYFKEGTDDGDGHYWFGYDGPFRDGWIRVNGNFRTQEADFTLHKSGLPGLRMFDPAVEELFDKGKKVVVSVVYDEVHEPNDYNGYDDIGFYRIEPDRIGVVKAKRVWNQIIDGQRPDISKLNASIRKGPLKGFHLVAEQVVNDEKMPKKVPAKDLVGFLRQRGVKPVEAKWLGLERLAEKGGVLTRDEIREWVALNKLEVEEIEQTNNDAKWNDPSYNEPGAKDVRNLIFRLPKWDYTNSNMNTHWPGIQGVFAHARVSMREDGKKLLVEELQSDWADAGRKQKHVLEEVYETPGGRFGVRHKYSKTPSTNFDYATREEAEQKLLKEHGYQSDEDFLKWKELGTKIANLVAERDRIDEEKVKVQERKAIEIKAKAREELPKYKLTEEETDALNALSGNSSLIGPGELTPEERVRLANLKEKYRKYRELWDIEEWTLAKEDPEYIALQDKYRGVVIELANATGERSKMGTKFTPKPPFPEDSDWATFVVKRLIRYAVENGAEAIAFTSGEQQADRWSALLAQHADEIGWNGREIVVYKGDKEVKREEVKEEDLHKYVGVKLADTLLTKFYEEGGEAASEPTIDEDKVREFAINSAENSDYMDGWEFDKPVEDFYEEAEEKVDRDDFMTGHSWKVREVEKDVEPESQLALFDRTLIPDVPAGNPTAWEIYAWGDDKALEDFDDLDEDLEDFVNEFDTEAEALAALEKLKEDDLLPKEFNEEGFNDAVSDKAHELHDAAEERAREAASGAYLESAIDSEVEEITHDVERYLEGRTPRTFDEAMIRASFLKDGDDSSKLVKATTEGSVGGEGHKEFYDRKMGSVVSKLAKQFDAKIEEGILKVAGDASDGYRTRSKVLKGERKYDGFRITDKMRELSFGNPPPSGYGNPHEYEVQTVYGERVDPVYGIYLKEQQIGKFYDTQVEANVDLAKMREDFDRQYTVKQGKTQPLFSIRKRRANPAETKTGKKLVERVDAARDARDDVLHDEQAVAGAERLMGNKERVASLYERVRLGEQLDAEETIAAKRMIAEATRNVRAMSPESYQQVVDLVDGYRETGRDQARALRVRGAVANMSRSDRIRSFLSDAIFSLPSRLDKAVKKDGKRRAKAREVWAKKVGDLLASMNTRGIDVADVLRDPDNYSDVEINRIVRDTQTMKSDVGDMVYEAWINFILSMPTTHIANVAGNATNVGIEYLINRPVEATINLFARDPEMASFGELPHLLRRVPRAAMQAARYYLTAMRSESAAFEQEVTGGPGVEKTEIAKAIPGVAGQAVRFLGGRMLTAEDEFFKAFIANIEVAAHAHRLAKSEGLSGEALRSRMDDLIDTPEVWLNALDDAKRLTFQTEPGEVLRKIVAARDTMHKAMFKAPVPVNPKYAVPFTTTIANLMSSGFRKSPVWTPKFAFDIMRHATERARGLEPTKTNREMAQGAADQLIAYGLLAVLASLTEDDDDDELPRITGTIPWKGTSRGERETANLTVPAMSIRVGGKTISYARWEPFATSAATIIDLLKEGRRLKAGETDPGEIMGTAGQKLLALVKEKSFARGIAEIVDAMEDTRYAADFVSKYYSGFVPNVVKGAARSGDDFVRDQKIAGKGSQFYKDLADKTKYRAFPAEKNAPPPLVDRWGRDVKKLDTGSKVGNVANRMLNPFEVRDLQDTPIDRMLLKWNEANPGSKYHPSRPNRHYTRDGKTLYMSDDEYHRFASESGQEAFRILGKLRLNLNDPTEKDIEKVRVTLSKTRAKWRKQNLKVDKEDAAAQ
jgi:hypothetical protein